MGLTCAKADVKAQAPLEENEDAQDRSDELLERWRSGELAHLALGQTPRARSLCSPGLRMKCKCN